MMGLRALELFVHPSKGSRLVEDFEFLNLIFIFLIALDFQIFSSHSLLQMNHFFYFVMYFYISTFCIETPRNVCLNCANNKSK